MSLWLKRGDATASPLPLAGEGQGGGAANLARDASPSPTLPRKRGREPALLAGRPRFVQVFAGEAV